MTCAQARSSVRHVLCYAATVLILHVYVLAAGVAHVTVDLCVQEIEGPDHLLSRLLLEQLR